MKMFLCATQGSFEFLVTTDEDRAFQLYAMYLALRKPGSSRAWVRELIPGKVIPPRATPLWNALSGFVEGFLHYHDGDGWVVQPIEQEFDKLFADAIEGEAA